MTDVTTLTAVKTLARKLALPLAGFVLMAIPGAFAEERPVIMTTKATADEIREFCKGQIAHYKIPRYIEFVPEFPMTITGKIQKFRIRELMQEELGLSEQKTA